MSDQTINQLHVLLKDINAKITKLSRRVDEFDMLVYRYKNLAYHMDLFSFEIRQEVNVIRDSCAQVTDTVLISNNE